MLSGPPDQIILVSDEVVRTSWWEVEFSSPSGQMPTDCQYKIRELPPLSKSVDVVSYAPINSQIIYPGLRQAVGSASIKMHLYDRDSLYDFFSEWFDLVHNEDEDTIGLYDDVVGQGTLKLYSAGDSDPVVSRSIRLIDCWPSGLTLGQATRDSDGDPYGYSVEIQVATFIED